MANETFFTVVADSETLSNRLTETAKHVAEVAEAKWGVTLDKDAVASLPEVRVSVLSGGVMDEDVMLREALNLQQVKDAMHRAAVDEALKAGEESALSEFDGLSPSQKITLARSRGLTAAPVNTKVKLSAEEEAKILRRLSTISDRGTRLAKAREWLGLV